MNLSAALLDVVGVRSIWQPEIAPGPGAPYLLVVLHGRGDSPLGFDWLLPHLSLPGLSAILLQAPDEYYTGFSWYDLPPDQGPGIMRSRVLLERVMEELWKQGHAPERTFMLGFSQGCLMTLEFGSRYPRKLAGYIGLSGYCYDEKKIITEAVPGNMRANWLVTHGDRDDVLPIEHTRAQIEALKAAGFAIDYREYRKAHTVDPRRELPELREWIAERMR